MKMYCRNISDAVTKLRPENFYIMPSPIIVFNEMPKQCDALQTLVIISYQLLDFKIASLPCSKYCIPPMLLLIIEIICQLMWK